MSDPIIIIGGREWRVPLLAPRQNRIVLPRFLALGSEPATQYGFLCDIAFTALTRAHSELSRVEFEDWPVPAYELIDALPIIAGQTGFLEYTPAKQVAEPVGSSSRGIDFDALIAQFCNFLPGTTPDYWEDALTAPRMRAMQEEWRKNPPLAALAASWLGYKPKPRNEDAVEELMRMFPTGELKLAPTLH